MSETGWNLLRSYPRVTRVEVIDSSGRAYVAYGLENVRMDLQDEGRTMKIFVDNFRGQEDSE